jgi:two-component system, cell cycle sensor histidine kinase and response regulator CckA
MASRPAGSPRAIILIVEDEDSVRSLTARMLQSEGYEVLTAADASEALMTLWGTPVHIDLVVSDVRMPGMDGETLARLIAAHESNCKFVFISGYPGSHTLPGPLLAKPFQIDDLLGMIQLALDGTMLESSG